MNFLHRQERNQLAGQNLQGDAQKRFESDANHSQDNGNSGQNEAEALEAIRKAAEQGDVVAQRLLDACYEYGRGVAQPHAEAAKRHREAAEDAQQEEGENESGAIPDVPISGNSNQDRDATRSSKHAECVSAREATRTRSSQRAECVSAREAAFDILAAMSDKELKALFVDSAYLVAPAWLYGFVIGIFLLSAIIFAFWGLETRVFMIFFCLIFSALLFLPAFLFRRCRSGAARKTMIFICVIMIANCALLMINKIATAGERLIFIMPLLLSCLFIWALIRVIKSTKNKLLFGTNAITHAQVKSAWKSRKKHRAWTREQCPPANLLPPKIDKGVSIACAVFMAFLVFLPIVAGAVVDTCSSIVSPNPEKLFEQAENYANGADGFKQDDAKAFECFRKAAEQGHAKAQACLGFCYFLGKGVRQDYAEAVKWFRKAAEQGQPDAQAWLGVCCENGYGVRQDLEEAVKWYRKAAKQGALDAQLLLGRCYAEGKGVRQDDAEAAEWFRRAAEQGDSDAQFLLGRCYEFGNGVEKDLVEAVKWYRKAAKQGDSAAEKALIRLGVPCR